MGDNTSLFDLIFNIALGFVLMFVISVLSIQIQHKSSDIKTQAEFVVILTWQEKEDLDVDLWIRDPQENLMFFKSKEVGIMHLDRDDLGNTHDTYIREGVAYISPANQEIATIRGFLPGEWIINAHLYRVGKQVTDTVAHCDVIITKLNPVANVILHKTFELKNYWDEITVARLMMASTGEVLGVEENIPLSLVETRLHRGAN